MKMIFTGEDWSLGFRKGYSYNIEIESKKGEEMILVYFDGRFVCPYSSLKTFLNNWKLEN